LDPREVVAHINVRHPEEALIVVVANLGFDIFGPEIGVVAPISLPFKVTPRVSKKH
jgi:hypothetical protein